MENSQEDPLQAIKRQFDSEHYGDGKEIVLPSSVEWLIAEVEHLRAINKSLESRNNLLEELRLAVIGIAGILEDDAQSNMERDFLRRVQDQLNNISLQ
jgi:hypothetical protein